MTRAVLREGKSTLTGTYFAEQVSRASYELVSVGRIDARPPPSAQGSRQGSAAAASAGGRRRHVQQEEATCRVLPALVSHETLLRPDDNSDSMTHQATSDAGTPKPEHLKIVERLEKSSARMARGERCTPRRKQGRSTPTDQQVMAGLTQPLISFGCKGLKKDPLSPPKSSRGKRYDTYAELFQAGLAGTEMATLSQTLTSPLARPASKRCQLRPLHRRAGEQLRLGGVARPPSVQVMPEDPVEAFFLSEKLADSEGTHDAAAANASPVSPLTRGAHDAASNVLPEASQETRRFQTRFEQTRRDSAKQTSVLKKGFGVLFDTASSPASPKPSAKSFVSGASSAGESAAVSGSAVGPVPERVNTVDTILDGSQATSELSIDETDKRAVPGPLAETSNHWAEVMATVLTPQKLTPARKDACLLLRQFIFGKEKAAGRTEQKRAVNKDKIFHETCGSKEKVSLLYNFWERLDDDNSGRVDHQEFRAFAEFTAGEYYGQATSHNNSSGGFVRRPSFELSPGRRRGDPHGELKAAAAAEEQAKMVTRMCDAVIAALLSRRTTFCIEDMMRVIWPAASLPDLKNMKTMCEEMAVQNSKWRVPSPRVLPPEELKELSAVFHHFDKEGSGEVSLDELVHNGLLDKDLAWKYFHEVDVNQDGKLDVMEFQELMCPTGARASATSEKATDEKGNRLIYDSRLGGWRREDKALGLLSGDKGWLNSGREDKALVK